MNLGFTYSFTPEWKYYLRLVQKDIFGNTAYTDFTVIFLSNSAYYLSPCNSDPGLRAKGFALDY